MRIVEVVRGADLVVSAARQAFLATLLGYESPSFAHVPLVVGQGGARLAKRDGATTIAEHRARGVSAPALIVAIARAYGQNVGPLDPLGDLTRNFDHRAFPGEPVTLDRILGATEAVLDATNARIAKDA